MDEWQEWRNHILGEIKDIKGILLSHNETLGGLKVKASLFGLIGGVLPVIVLIAIEVFTNRTPF